MKQHLLRKNLFTHKIELLNLLLPFLFFILIFLDYSGINVLSHLSHFQSDFLTNIIFLNITHNAFTFVLLTSTLPLSLWVESQGGERKFWREQIFIVLVLTLLFASLFYFSFHNRIVFLVFILINFNFAAHHALSQTFGLSLLYNRKDIRTEVDIKSEKVERRLFDLFLFSNLIVGTAFILFSFKFIAIAPENLYLFIKYSGAWILLLALGLIGQSFYFYKKDFVAKGLFNARYLLWPVTLFSPTAIFATTAIHGLEYGFVTDKMIKNDSFRKPKLALGITILVILLAIVRMNGVEQIRAHERLSPWLAMIAGLSVALSFLHYYLDRRLFKMRHKINRETVGLLLFKDPGEKA